MLKEIIDQMETSTSKALRYFKGHFHPETGYGNLCHDLCCYYKSPMMFISANMDEDANRQLDFIKNKFMTSTGDFMTSAKIKSIKPEYTDYWSYTNGWIARASGKLKRNDIFDPSYNFLIQSFLPKTGTFVTHGDSSNEAYYDILTSSHLGLLSLENDNTQFAISAGNYLIDCINKQPDLSQGFYLRTSLNGTFITNFNEAKKPFYIISRQEPHQLYFMLGYPIAFLITLYKATFEGKYLNAAQAYANFALSCNESIFNSDFSHKLAWGLSMLYGVHQENQYLEAIKRIVEHFIRTQDNNGLWHAEDMHTALDQSAEIVCWFNEIKNQFQQLNQEKQTNDILNDEAPKRYKF